MKNLNTAIFRTQCLEITLRKLGGAWHVQVMEGAALTKHVQTREFDSYDTAFHFVQAHYLM